MTTASAPSLRSVIAGFLLSLLLCAINSYLTLSFGVIEEGPTIAALFFFAFFFLSRTPITTHEMVIVATMGSAGGSLGFISNFYAAKAMTGQPYSVVDMTLFATITSVVGLLFVIPLRELLVLRENLPWPSSKATAGVISALVEKGDPRQVVVLLVVGLTTMAYVVGNTDGGFGWFPDGTSLPVIAAWGGAIAWSPFAIGSAYLMGMRTCVGFLVGAVVLMVMAPHLPEPDAPHRYVWPGIGFLVATGLTAMLVNWKVIVAAMRSLTDIRVSSDDDSILRGRGLALFAAVALGSTILFLWLGMGLNLLLVVILVVLGGLIQNIIATRAAAQTAFNPARVMGVLLQGACALAGGRGADVNLTGAGFVAGSGAQAGNLTGDMAYGRWFKVPARWQFWTQSITVLPCAYVSALVFQWIQGRTKLSLESGEMPAPVAKIWAATALIFDGQRAMPPHAAEAMMVGAAVGVLYVLAEANPRIERWLPSSVGIGIGMVLPVAYDLSFFLGGVLLWTLHRAFKVRELTLNTVAVACIVAEGLGGVLKPILSMVGVIR
ncbi:MAG: OPT/YSL family transporter [Myxococcota bacterium]